MLRGTEILVFALIFVAAVGFGPFTGVLAITFNMVGALGKLLTEAIEPADPGPIEAIQLTGAGPVKTFRAPCCLMSGRILSPLHFTYGSSMFALRLFSASSVPGIGKP
jgi:hypothetical protein